MQSQIASEDLNHVIPKNPELVPANPVGFLFLKQKQQHKLVAFEPC